MKVVFEAKIAGFPILLMQEKPERVEGYNRDRYRVVYFKQVDTDLDYPTAARKLGEALMHACACDGRLSK